MCQQMKSFLTKKSANQPIIFCLWSHVKPARKFLPSPLVDFNRLFEGLIGALFKTWLLNTIYFLKRYQSGPKIKFILAVLAKATLMHCPLQKLEENKPGFHGAWCRLAPCQSQTTWTHTVQCTGNKQWIENRNFNIREESMATHT